MKIHESCNTQNDIAYTSPISGKRGIRKLLGGVWTRTIIQSECKGGKSGPGSAYGPGGSGPGHLVKSGRIREGGTTSRPDQSLMVFMGES